MAENTYAKIYIKNKTGSALNLKKEDLSSGKYDDDPPAQIADGKEGYFKPQGRKDTATGAEGYVEYSDSHKAIFKIKFDIPYSANNSASITFVNSEDFSGGFTYGQYNSDYTKSRSTPKSGNPDLYFLIEYTSDADVKSNESNSFSQLLDLSEQAQRTSLSIEEATELSCQAYSKNEVTKLFSERVEVTAEDILTEKRMPLIDRVRFTLDSELLSPRTSVLIGVKLIEQSLPRLATNKTLQDLVTGYLSDVRDLINGSNAVNLDGAINQILTQRELLGECLEDYKRCCLFDALLSLVEVAPHSVAANVASQIRCSAQDDSKLWDQVVAEHFNYVKSVILSY